MSKCQYAGIIFYVPKWNLLRTFIKVEMCEGVHTFQKLLCGVYKQKDLKNANLEHLQAGKCSQNSNQH